MSYGSVAWGDYDSDGDLDILLAGDLEPGYVSRLYRNDGGSVFTDTDAGLSGVFLGSVGWGDYDVTKQETLYSYYGGIAGWVQHLPRRPGYAPACNHFIHFGHHGFVFNIRYLELIDFLLGWTTLDLCGDDGEDVFGHWPWQA